MFANARQLLIQLFKKPSDSNVSSSARHQSYRASLKAPTASRLDSSIETDHYPGSLLRSLARKRNK